MAINPDGLQVLKGLGIAALVLLSIALRFSNWPGELFARLIEAVLHGLPLSSRTKKNRRIREREQHRRTIVFDCFVGVVASYLVADWFLIPEPYRLSDERRWPIGLSVLLAGSIVIFVGSQTWSGRVAWKKWSFWMSLLATFAGELWLIRIWQPLRPKGALFVLIMGGLFFLWMFGLLLRVEQGEAALHELEVSSNRQEAPQATDRKQRKC